MKRILCLILALLLLTPAAFADEDLTFTMSSVSGKVGDTVAVVASVKNAPVCASYQVIFTYDDTVLEVVKGENVNSDGIFMINTDTSNGGKKAVNALAADADKVLEGDTDLFKVTFKIIGKPANEKGTLLEMGKNEFIETTKLKQLYPTVEPCRITVTDDTAAEPLPDDEPPVFDDDPDTDEKPDTDDEPESDETPSTGNDATTGAKPNTGTGSNAETAPETNENTGATDSAKPEKDDKKPTGSWVVDENNDEIHHVTEDGDATVYHPEYTEKPEEGKVTEIILKDEEGKDAGSIKVEKQEDGTLEVVEQDLSTDKNGFPGWGWAVCMIAAVVIAGGAVVLALKKRQNDKEIDEEEADREE